MVMSRSWFAKARTQRSPRFRARLEVLEDRTVLSFFTTPSFGVGKGPVAQAVGDFNGDGQADLVVVNQTDNSVSVVLGKSDGSFQPRTDYATGSTPVGVAVGDFNGDGKLDVAVANFGGKSVSVLLGNGDGTLQPKTDITLSTTPVSLAAVDLNGDGKLDLAVATEDLSNDYVTILKGNGDGTFGLPVSTTTDTAPKGTSLLSEELANISVGDFNGDGKPDLVVVNNKDGFRVARFGGGAFFSAGTVSVLLGNGDGTLQAARNSAVGTSPRSVAVGDFNGDGRTDVVVGNFESGSVSVFMNTGGGNFSTSSLSAGGAPFALAAGDLNGDGRTDLAVSLVTFAVAPDLNVFLGQAGGSLQSAASYVTPVFDSLSAVDLNGDGHSDLVGAVSGTANVVSELLNNGDGTFPAPVLIPNPGVTLASQATADFNGDGIPDRVTASSGQVQLGLGDGFFGDTTLIQGGASVAAADVDGNGTPDVLIGSSGFPGNEVALIRNSPGWDNRTGGAVGFTVSAPQQVTAGAATSVTVTAVDALGNPVPGFLGTVDLDSTLAGSTQKFAGQYSFTAADGGKHTFLVTGLNQAGDYTLSTFAVAMPTVSVPVSVAPAAVAQFGFAVPTSVTAGTPFSFTVTAEDKFGNVEPGYAGTVHFGAMTSDTQAVLPADYTFTAADAGTHTFSATLFKTAGTSSPFLSAKDVATGVSSLKNVSVTPLAPVSLSMSSLPSPLVAGTPASVTVTALDTFGNVASGYTGTVHFSSSDAQAVLPADYTFTAADAGRHTFTSILKTVGTQSLTVADTANAAFTSTQSGIAVVPGAPAVWVVSGLPASTVAGAAQTFTLTAMDAFGNVATNYFGQIQFSSSDVQAGLPANYTFTAADAGVHTFAATLKTTGTQSITFADTVNPAFTGTQSITVTPAASSLFVVAGFPATTAGVAQNFTVTVKDGFGNVDTNYTGTIAFSSSDPLAGLPANYTFTAADAGVHTFTATLKKAGTQSLTTTDVLASSVRGVESGIVVSPAAVSHLAIVAPATVTQGVGFSLTVSAVDDFGNVNPGYRSKVHLSSTDPRAGTQDFTYSNNDNGVHVFSYTFPTLGSQTLTIVDTTNSSIVGSVVENVVPK
jgi:FG-GAP-like repeat